MDLTITPTKLAGRIYAPPSKSELHRVLICAALCDGMTDIIFPGEVPDDVSATARCLTALGTDVVETGEGFTVCGGGEILKNATLDCGESGTTLRLLAALSAALGADGTFIGGGRLPERPMEELYDCLSRGGCHISSDALPVSITGKLQSGEYELSGGVSSQFCSGLLLALPLLPGESRILMKNKPGSRGYIDMTVQTMTRFGVKVTETENGFIIPGGQVYRTTGRKEVSGDWSAGAAFLCAGALGGDVRVYGLKPDSRQADRAICAMINAEGNEVYCRVRTRFETAFEADCTNTPDIVPMLSVLACGCRGVSTIRGVSRLAHKESDRVSAVWEMINSLGGECAISGDSLVINGRGELSGGTVDTHNDHRIAMAAAVAACLCTDAVTVRNAQCVNKSYPGFWRDYSSLGGSFIEI